MDALQLDVVRRPDPATSRAVVDLVERASSARGHAALSEAKRIELAHPADRSPTSSSVGVVARAPAGSGPVGYAHLSGDPAGGHYAVEVVIDPTLDPAAGTADAPADALVDALLDAAVGVVAEQGGGELRLWVAQAGASDDSRARRHGFAAERDLIQMRCRLPLPGPAAPSDAIRTRPFRPGLDEEAWLATNNRAFAGHPEQGHWTLATLVEREKEPWFDPDGLLLLEHDGRLAGSCWTKIHDRTDPPMGEIYVIGVDPEFHGRGWGRALTRAGLDWLSAQGLGVGMLYVDSDNRPAVGMYRSMGFDADHVDRAYLRRVEAR